MKVKDVNVNRGRKYSNNYQSVDYHIGITIEGEEEDDIEDMRDYALTNLMAMETQEEIRCRLVIEEVKAEQIVDEQIGELNAVAKTKLKNTEQFNKETLEEEEKSIEWITHEGKKYKACKYGCLLLVSWDKDKKDYVHYNKDFVYVMDKCPKYAGGG